MANWTSAKALAVSQAARFAVLNRSIRAQHRQMVESMAQDAQELTSGTVSTATLRALGHPFSRRLARSRGGASKAISASGISRLPINQQTGRLKRSARIIPETTAHGQSFRFQFTAPHAKFVLAPGGTRRMVARGFWPEMRRRWRPKNRKLIYDMRLKTLEVMYRRTA